MNGRMLAILVCFMLALGCAGEGGAGEEGAEAPDAAGELNDTQNEGAEEDAGQEEEPGEAPESMEIRCGETDGGYDPNSKGTTTVTEGGETIWEKEDYCLDSRTLVEYYCEVHEAAHESVKCTCSGGACIPVVDYVECVDSDGGNDKWTAGQITQITHYTDGTVEEKEVIRDVCMGSNIVKEYVCRDDGSGNYRKVEWTCLNCEDGACTE